MILRSPISALSVLVLCGFFTATAAAQPIGNESTAPAAAAATTAAAPATAERTPFEARIDAELGVAGGLTADDVARRAVATNWSLEARRADVRVAEANASRASAGYVPELTLTARYTRLSDTNVPSLGSVVSAPTVAVGEIPPGTALVSVPLSFPVLLNQYVLQASLLVPVTDYFLRVAPAHEAGKLMTRAARENLAATEQATAADAKITYYTWVRAQLASIVAEQALADARAHRGDVSAAVQAGTASQADLLSVEARVAESERLLASSRYQVEQLTEELRIARHDPESTTYAIGEDVRVDGPDAPPDRLSALVAQALAQRPELDALELRAASAARETRLERAAYYPRLDLFANAQYSNPNPRVVPQQEEFTGTWDAGAQLTWRLSDLPAAASAARAAEATVASIRAERKELEDRVRREVSAARSALLDAEAAIPTSERELAAAEESYRVRRLLFQNGRATSVELLDSELELTRARLSTVNARLARRIARVRLDYALGQSLPNSGRRG